MTYFDDDMSVSLTFIANFHCWSMMCKGAEDDVSLRFGTLDKAIWIRYADIQSNG